MTKKLIDLFNLPPEQIADLESSAEDSQSVGEDDLEATPEMLNTLERIDRAMARVVGIEKTDGELDELKDLAVNSYRDLMDLGMNTDPRFSAEIFSTAASFMGHAVNTVEAKANKKLKMLELQLKKAQLDHKISTTATELDAVPLGTGHSLDRN